MISKKKAKIITKVILILWLLCCPELYMQDGLCYLQRTDGKEITISELQEIWEQIYQTGDWEEISYKIGFLEWLETIDRSNTYDEGCFITH